MAIFRPARRLKMADFPTFGRPTMAMVGMGGSMSHSRTITKSEIFCGEMN
jgi:hypothetical protein